MKNIDCTALADGKLMKEYGADKRIEDKVE